MVEPLRLDDLFAVLYRAYGPQHWWPAESAFEMIVGAFLVQNTAWQNVEKALVWLKAADALSIEAIRARTVDALAELIRPSGSFRQKARRLKAFVEHLDREHGGRLEPLLGQDAATLRRELLGLPGIGPETADSIVLYAAGHPSFIADAYARRLFDRLGVLRRPTYDEVQAFCHANLRPEAAYLNEFHALIVRHCVTRCRTRPRCSGCPLQNNCRLGSAASPGDGLAGATPPRREGLNELLD